jgi:hypothetical protein
VITEEVAAIGVYCGKQSIENGFVDGMNWERLPRAGSLKGFFELEEAVGYIHRRATPRAHCTLFW